MKTAVVHECGCARCRTDGDSSTRELHAELNRFLSTLDKKLRAQFLGMESTTTRYDDAELEEITGVKAAAIAKARWELHRHELIGRIEAVQQSKLLSYQTRTFYYEARPGKSICVNAKGREKGK